MFFVNAAKFLYILFLYQLWFLWLLENFYYEMFLNVFIRIMNKLIEFPCN